MAKVEAVNLAPEPAEILVLDEWAPAFEGPVLDGVEDFVEREGEGQRGVAGEEPRPGGHEPLHEGEGGREDHGEHRERIPREKRGLALLGGGDGVDVFDERHLAATGRATPADAGEVVMERVLLVEAAEEADDRLVENVAVEEVFEAAGEQVHREEGADEGPDRESDLGGPDGLRGQEPKETDQACEGNSDREQEQRKGEFLFNGGGGVRGMGHE